MNIIKKSVTKEPKITPKNVANDDRTGSVTGAPSPKERASMDKKPATKYSPDQQSMAKKMGVKLPATENYHTKAQKYITGAKKMGMTVKAEGGELIAYPKKK